MRSIHVTGSDQSYTPGKIVCVGRNYAAHAAELGNEVPEFPLVFLKPVSSMIASGEHIVLPDYSNEVHHEIELVLLLDKTIKNASEEIAESAIAGYGVGLDMTARDKQDELRKKGEPWTLAKCFDTSALVSEFVKKETIPDILQHKIQLWVNGELRQDAELSLMLFKPAQIVAYLSKIFTLEAGDIIFTGTPKGVSKVHRGDKLEGEIEGVAKLQTVIV